MTRELGLGAKQELTRGAKKVLVREAGCAKACVLPAKTVLWSVCEVRWRWREFPFHHLGVEICHPGLGTSSATGAPSFKWPLR